MYFYIQHGAMYFFKNPLMNAFKLQQIEIHK